MQQEILISRATKNNWSRLNFTEQDIRNKLTKRANKRYSKKTIIPVEYFVNPENINTLYDILKICKDKEVCIYSLALNLLLTNNLIHQAKNNFISENNYINEILEEYKNITPNKNLLTIKLPNDEKDFLGIVYQSLLNEGSKNKQGSYYTPQTIINSITSNLQVNTKYLDPCCGTGSFLLSASEIIQNPENIYGYDIDKIACFIAKINLILKYKNIKFRPNIFNKDFLEESIQHEKFDIIATNPPWGAITQKKYKKIYPEITSGESFSYFIIKSSKLLKNKGKMYFVLPESILNVKKHQDVRQFLLNNFHINKFEFAGRAFSSVLSNVIILHLDKNMKISTVTIQEDNNRAKIIDQNYYKQNTNNNFSILDNKDIKILEKIYSVPHLILDETSQWALGIVTGNNSKHISQNKNSGEKIFSGKNISKYKISDTDKYIIYNREQFQQVAPDNIYRAKEKLVYKFISKKLIFAYDNKQRLFLNSANILIPNLNGYTQKASLAFLNSTLFQYIYKKKFNELKVLKGNLMELPFPVIDKNNIKTLSELIEKFPTPEEEIDNIIFKIFNLTDDEIKYIKNEI